MNRYLAVCRSPDFDQDAQCWSEFSVVVEAQNAGEAEVFAKTRLQGCVGVQPRLVLLRHLEDDECLCCAEGDSRYLLRGVLTCTAPGETRACSVCARYERDVEAEWRRRQRMPERKEPTK